MKKLQRRAIICLFFAAILVVGTGIYIALLGINGDSWVSYPANRHVFTKGKLTTGTILDSEGKVLLKNTKKGKQEYSSDPETRKATLHAVGDVSGNIATGANVAFRDKLVGYNFITGTYSASGKGRRVDLTISSRVSKVANEALAGRSGTVGVYNYKTGEILCMVSSPNYDPYTPPANNPDDKSGAFINRFTSAKVVPGSIFKLITATAAIEEIEDISSFRYRCTGSRQFDSSVKDRITCVYPHGDVDFKDALAVSCNCAFGEIAIKVGGEKMKKYAQQAGLTNSYSIDGINTMPGSFEFPANQVNLAWAGIGQHKDLVNPCSMMVYMGAVANGGKAANPRLIHGVKFNNGFPASLPFKTKTDELISEETASKLSSMMRNNVIRTYGKENFKGLDICAKSGTAESGKTNAPNAWFTGFLRNEDHPYAFIVLVEKGGFGGQVAGSVANRVLQEAVKQGN
ncbi:MAG: penicillin-binding transpeptidase domain-containing protein [Anaerovoracaceae bacterium]